MFCLDEELNFQKSMKFITGTSTMPLLGMPRKIKVSFKYVCSLGWAYEIIVNTCVLQVNLPCYYTAYAAILEMIVSSAKLSRRFDAVWFTN